MQFFTIGVFNSSEDEFFQKLVENNIDTFCDIRQRRGVRGSKYAFVNNQRLQKKLSELQIKYAHIIKLAPTNEIRQLQKDVDLVNKELKTERKQLGTIFKYQYKTKILSGFNFENFFDQLDNAGSSRVVLFCVEEIADACHRSLVAQQLKD